MAKQIQYGEQARRSLEKGVNALAGNLKNPPGPEGRHGVVGQKDRGPPLHNHRGGHAKGSGPGKSL